jgi:Protein of unknown function (DUF421)
MGSFFGSVDWVEVFVPQAPLIETFVRGSLLYLGLVAQNAMAGPHHAVGDGFGLLVTILAWSVVCDGRLIAANLRRELMTRDELRAQRRKQGIEDVGQVKGAWIEADGSVSVIRRRSA